MQTTKIQLLTPMVQDVPVPGWKPKRPGDQQPVTKRAYEKGEEVDWDAADAARLFQAGYARPVPSKK